MSRDLDAETVAVLAPFLTEAGKEAAKRSGGTPWAPVAGSSAAARAPAGAEVLADLETAPDLTDNRADLRKPLAKLLDADPALVPDLCACFQMPARPRTSEPDRQRRQRANKGNKKYQR